MRNIVLFGRGQFAEIAQLYLAPVVGITVEEKYCTPFTVAFENAAAYWNPDKHDFFAAIVYGDMNRTRERIYKAAKAKGYGMASYGTDDVCGEFGEHCFVFPGNIINPFVKVGNNVVMWNGNHIGHHSVIEDNAFISSHVVISGNCRIGRNSFIGVNATIGDGVTIGEYSWVSPGAIITKDIPPHSLVKSIKSEVVELDETRLFK